MYIYVKKKKKKKKVVGCNPGVRLAYRIPLAACFQCPNTYIALINGN